MPPILIPGNGDRLPDCTVAPLTTGVDVGPKPLAYSTTVSPGLAGVGEPRCKPAGPRRSPLAWVAATYAAPLNTPNDGGAGCACAESAAAADPLLVITSC